MRLVIFNCDVKCFSYFFLNTNIAFTLPKLNSENKLQLDKFIPMFLHKQQLFLDKNANNRPKIFTIHSINTHSIKQMKNLHFFSLIEGIEC